MSLVNLSLLVMVFLTFLIISRMAMDMLTIYLHYEGANQEAKILQISMMRRDVSYYDLIFDDRGSWLSGN